MNDHDKSPVQAQPNDYARELAGLLSLLETVDRQITPEHVAHRFRELLDDIGDGGPPAPSSHPRLNTAAAFDDQSAPEPYAGDLAAFSDHHQAEWSAAAIACIAQQQAAEIIANASQEAEACRDERARSVSKRFCLVVDSILAAAALVVVFVILGLSLFGFSSLHSKQPAANPTAIMYRQPCFPGELGPGSTGVGAAPVPPGTLRCPIKQR